jgi:DNA-binding XRE family transcriptional regulator
MKLVQMRKKNGMTQQQLAKAIGVSRGLIARIEAGWEKPYPRIKKAIAEALKSDEKYLFGKD